MMNGVIQEMHISEDLRKTKKFYSITLKSSSGQIVSLDISESEYLTLKKGDKYSKIWKKGSLGLIYR